MQLFLMYLKGRIYNVYSYIQDKTKKYKIIRGSKYKKAINVKIIKHIDGTMFQREFNNLLNTKLEKYILHFKDVLEANFKKEELELFYRNIKSINFKELQLKIDDEFNFEGIPAIYLPTKNEIVYYDIFLEDAIYHELFHVASTINVNKEYAASGFHHIYENSRIGYNISDKINEGYTELLKQRYFGMSLQSEKTYSREKNIVSYLEKIIGKEKMESLYLTANLDGLILEMQKYFSIEEMKDLFFKIDFSCQDFEDKNVTQDAIYIQKTLRDVYIILFKGYARKIFIPVDNIDSVTYLLRQMNSFFPYDNSMINIGGKKYVIITKKDLFDITLKEYDDKTRNKANKI